MKPPWFRKYRLGGILLFWCGLILNCHAEAWMVYDRVDKEGHAVQDWMRERVLEIGNVKDSIPIYFRIIHQGQRLSSPHHYDYEVIGAQLLTVRGSEYLYGMQTPQNGGKIVIQEKLKQVWNKGDKMPKRRLRKIGEKKNGKPKYEWANVGTKEATSSHNAWPLISVGDPELLCINLAKTTVPPEEKETIGVFCEPTNNDDDKNGKPDKDDERLAGGDNNLFGIRIMHPRLFPTDLTWDDAVIHVYETGNKQFRGGYSSRIGTGSGQHHYKGYDDGLIYAEGINPGTTLLTLTGPGGFQDKLRITVVKIDMAMDGNRDGIIDFQNPEDKKYLFWVNNDIDINRREQEDDIKEGKTDCEDNVISCKRDLEDFTRLHLLLNTDIVKNPEISVCMAFDKTGGGNPSINIFKAVEPGWSYLKNHSAADRQMSERKIMTINTGKTTVSNGAIMADNRETHWLIEGKGCGKVKLSIVLQNSKGRELFRSHNGVELELRPITDFYEKFMVSISSNDFVQANASQANRCTYQPANTEYLLFVHGWNMEEWEKDRWTETVFKRLWWQGYKGRIGLFSWPTLSGFEWYTPASKSDHYNHSELRAWQSGVALRNVIQELNVKCSGQVRIFAHSMGNVVVGEALRLGPDRIVHSYLAAQAAIPAQMYDTQVTNYWSGWKTPNIYAHYFSGTDTTRPYLADNIRKVGKLIRYYNPVDYALGKWCLNNELKPARISHYNYTGRTNAYDSQTGDRFYYDRLFTRHDDRTLMFEGDRYEIFAFCLPSWSLPLGTESMSITEFRYQINLKDSFRYNDQRYSHSREFRSNIADEWFLWKAIANHLSLGK